MDANIDGKALLNKILISKLDDGTPHGKMLSDVMRVFERYGIDVTTATGIFIELQEVTKRYEN